MTDNISLSGVVATVPRVISTSTGLAITSFRLASSQRRYDRTKNVWVDGETNWYTINTFRGLADHVAVSVFKSDRVIVNGRLRIRPWEKDGKTGTAVEVDAEALGHDLFWGTAVFTRVSPAAQQPHASADQQAPEPNPSGWSQPLSGEATSGGSLAGDTHPSEPLPGDSAATAWSLPGAAGGDETSAPSQTLADGAVDGSGVGPDDGLPPDPGEPAWAVEQTETPF